MDTVHSIPAVQSKMESYGNIENVPLIPIGAALLAVSYIAILYFQRRRTVNIPLVASELDEKQREQKFLTDALSLFREGYAKLKDGRAMYRMTAMDGSEILVVDHKYLEELKSLPEEQLNFRKGSTSMLVSKYSLIGLIESPLALHTIKSDLTPGLPRLMPIISEEIDVAFARVMPPCEDWTPVQIHRKLLDIVSEVSARVFIGKPLCRDPRWQEITRDYTVKAFAALKVIKPWKPWMRPFVWRFLPELRDLYKTRDEAIKFMRPISKDRYDVEHKERDDFTEWMKRKANPQFATDYETQAAVQLSMAVAAIHTTSMATAHMIYDLIEHPEYIEPLREEIKSVLAETGGFQKETMAKFQKLDSFMKESQRVNPTGYTTFRRFAVKDITLSDGAFIPAKSVIEIDQWNRYRDDSIMENGNEFDGFRFYRLRQRSPEDNNLHQFATSSLDYLTWGQGRHACPGRFFATNEIKSILAKLLLAYDIAPVNKEAGRPKNHIFGASIMPDTNAGDPIQEEIRLDFL